MTKEQAYQEAVKRAEEREARRREAGLDQIEGGPDDPDFALAD